MHVERQYRELEKIEEIRVYNIERDEVFHPSEPVKKLDNVRFSNVMKHVPSDINVFQPMDDGDFLVERIGWNLLERLNLKLEDVEGRRFSEASPFYCDIFKDTFNEVLETGETKVMRIFYYISDKIVTLANIHILSDEGKIYVVSDLTKAENITKSVEEQKKEDDENKATLIEYFSQTGSFYKAHDEYTWTPGIYNIINRTKETSDAFYNIIFDLVIPEDKPLVEELLGTMSPETDTYENIIRIKTPGGHIKYLDTYLYSKFDENGEEVSSYGLFKDISIDSHKHLTRPVDFMLNGFNHNSKLSLLVEPLSKRYEFSEGFYKMIEVPKSEYIHNESILNNIVEEDVRRELEKLIAGDITEVNKVLTYKVKGDKENSKVCELFIERFRYGNKNHSIGFLTDITLPRKKQQELIKSNATKNILIKEVHHRVKNNLQVLNSFLNLEKRAYGDNPNRILDNMQARLSSLALLHEKTYNTEDFININLGDYMKDQDSTLHMLFGAKNINFTSDVDPRIHLSMDVITPLLLIVDELTMNAIKHAFPDPDMPNKTISKKIDFIDDNICELILKDNGVGLKDPDALVNHNLGWEIINNLTRQINGELELLDCEVGTGFRIIFPVNFKHTIDQHKEKWEENK
ncbi:histidine kinase dimerization/phosphoacceptor domain -containing protein [Methanobrevibacter sp. UBA212]|uniref:histidine kinase dimerization/phosphoacceptor domain -containing protein n=1 Tax=Methanobrevibacter sp. UBA212 TaxID=1915476 RepID=UPI0025D02130|nr:histidine kinase dimerization/phosphoacceptor domain -containing protein [Methanobrevibacter sp. UBA212]MEE1150597.1 histidine kinase dimerization/phosphoacceptor domain -containing protein [Methanobrevibacter sp.]